MPTHRSLRMAEAIREVVATAILFDVADPRVHSVTVPPRRGLRRLAQRHGLRVDHGDRGRAEAGVQGLDPRDRLPPARVAARLQTRFTPVLSFKHDDSVKKSVELARLIDEAVASDQRPNSPDPHTSPMPDRLEAAARPLIRRAQDRLTLPRTRFPTALEPLPERNQHSATARSLWARTELASQPPI